MTSQYRFAILDLTYAIQRVRWTYHAELEADPRRRLTSNDVLLSDFAARAEACALVLLDEDTDRRTRERTGQQTSHTPAPPPTSEGSGGSDDGGTRRGAARPSPQQRPAHNPLKNAEAKLRSQFLRTPPSPPLPSFSDGWPVDPFASPPEPDDAPPGDAPEDDLAGGSTGRAASEGESSPPPVRPRRLGR